MDGRSVLLSVDASQAAPFIGAAPLAKPVRQGSQVQRRALQRGLGQVWLGASRDLLQRRALETDRELVEQAVAPRVSLRVLQHGLGCFQWSPQRLRQRRVDRGARPDAPPCCGTAGVRGSDGRGCVASARLRRGVAQPVEQLGVAGFQGRPAQACGMIRAGPRWCVLALCPGMDGI